MKQIIIAIVAVIILAVILLALNGANMENERLNNSEAGERTAPVQVMPISHATAILTWDTSNIYTDPTGGAEAFQGKPNPDFILITDIHGDHFSTSTLGAVAGSSTIIVPQAVKDIMPEKFSSQTRVMKNGDKVFEQGFQIEAVPMYNVPESEDSRHTKGRGNGYIIEKNDFRVYIAGDTGATTEMRALTDIDIAFVPMNLPFTMGVDEAANAVLDFKPKQVYPYHYRGQDGLSDINMFKQLVNEGDKDIEVVLLDWYPEQ